MLFIAGCDTGSDGGGNVTGGGGGLSVMTGAVTVQRGGESILFVWAGTPPELYVGGVDWDIVEQDVAPGTVVTGGPATATLTVALAETRTNITVRARTALDPDRQGTLVITIPVPVINSVAVYPVDDLVYDWAARREIVIDPLGQFTTERFRTVINAANVANFPLHWELTGAVQGTTVTVDPDSWEDLGGGAFSFESALTVAPAQDGNFTMAAYLLHHRDVYGQAAVTSGTPVFMDFLINTFDTDNPARWEADNFLNPRIMGTGRLPQAIDISELTRFDFTNFLWDDELFHEVYNANPRPLGWQFIWQSFIDSLFENHIDPDTGAPVFGAFIPGDTHYHDWWDYWRATREADFIAGWQAIPGNEGTPATSVLLALAHIEFNNSWRWPRYYLDTPTADGRYFFYIRNPDLPVLLGDTRLYNDAGRWRLLVEWWEESGPVTFRVRVPAHGIDDIVEAYLAPEQTGIGVWWSLRFGRAAR